MKTKKLSSKTAKAKQTKVVPGKRRKPSPKHEGVKIEQVSNLAASPWNWPEHEAWSLEVKGRPDLTKLKRTILKHGGDRFQRNDFLVEQFDTKISKRLLAKGQVVSAHKAILFPMEPSGCHGNAMLLGADPRAEKWFGFALSGDGCWRAHSWLIRKRDRRVIETTESRTTYFGVRMPIPAKHAKFYATKGVRKMPQVKALFEDP